MKARVARAFSVSLLIVCIVCSIQTQGAGIELLGNGSFDVGALPPWGQQYKPPTAGAVATSTAARTGAYGLWQYTAAVGAFSFSMTYQTVSATPGILFRGSAYARSAPVAGGGSWVSGSFASLRLDFIGTSGSILATYESQRVTDASSGWQELSVISQAAPHGTISVRFGLYLEKPAGAAGQSVANFDDCSLVRYTPTDPILDVSVRALGYGYDLNTLGFSIRNLGAGMLHWNLSSGAPWIHFPVSSGETGSTRDSIVVVVDRGNMQGSTLAHHGTVRIESDGGMWEVNAYAERLEAGSFVPDSTSILRADGHRVLLRRRMSNGSLGIPEPVRIMGACWSPAGVGTLSDDEARRLAFQRFYRLDIQMMKEMNANAVYTYLDFGTTAEAFELLDFLYANGIMAIVTVDRNGTYDMNRLTEIVSAYRNHPAILMWSVGNEWAINLYHGHCSTLLAAADSTEAAARRIKALDGKHLVASVYGEINDSIEHVVNDVCRSVDVWGLNVYRGSSFGALFAQWDALSTKPMFIAEYGADSYRTVSWKPPVFGYIDESMQADFDDGLWREAAHNLSYRSMTNVCVGATVFEWCDEWWKTGDPSVHEYDGYIADWGAYVFPDSFGNEEYFGIVNADRSPKQSYARLQDDFSDVIATVGGGVGEGDRDEGSILRLVVGDKGSCAVSGGGIRILLMLTRPSRTSVDIFDVSGRLVRTLVDQALPAGNHQLHWDGRNARGRDVASGVYFCRARAGTYADTTKILIVR
jgi:hypothetical protein